MDQRMRLVIACILGMIALCVGIEWSTVRPVPNTVEEPASDTYRAPAPKVSTKQVECMARAVYWEARGQDVKGQMAVAFVVKHRMEHRGYPASACGVVHQDGQFTGKIGSSPKETKAWEQAREIALLTLSGYLVDPVPGALYFQRPQEAKWWAKRYKVEKVTSIGGHVFYKERAVA